LHTVDNDLQFPGVDTPPETHCAADDPYVVSALVSTYNAERLIRGCLEDLELQTIASRLEIIVIDSGSREDERTIVEEFRRSHDNVVYIRTEERESLYAAWNRGIRVARGKYLTNANTDDRHRRDALERMATVLDADSDVALVYGDVAATDKENQSFDSSPTIGAALWPDFDAWSLFLSCYVGPQPMWRKAVHHTYGFFDGSLRSAGDYEFWLRMARRERFHHIPEILGLYLYSDAGIQLNDQQLSMRESVESRERHWPREWEPVAGFCVDYGVRAPGGSDLTAGACESLRPLVSIIMTTSGQPPRLVRTMESLTAQSLLDFEVVLVADNGRDPSGVVAPFRPHMCLQQVVFSNDLKGSAKRTVGLKIARGKYITYLDDRTVLHPHHLRTLVDYLEEHGCRAAYTSARRVEADVGTGRWERAKRRLRRAIDFKFGLSPEDDLLATPCVMHERSRFDAAGYSDEALEAGEGRAAWDRMAKKSAAAHIRRTTAERVEDVD
jgi:glycosyltransferase involved in cell wall biosynthesis